MSQTFVDVAGLDNLTRDLYDLPAAIVAELFPDALSAGGDVMREALSARTPQAEESSSSKEYGTLRADIATEIDIDTELLTGSAKTGFGAKGFVARFVEYGHRELSHSRAEIGEVEPHPFMRPSADASADKAFDAFADSLATQK